jgi:hypothetical protein
MPYTAMYSVHSYIFCPNNIHYFSLVLDIKYLFSCIYNIQYFLPPPLPLPPPHTARFQRSCMLTPGWRVTRKAVACRRSRGEVRGGGGVCVEERERGGGLISHFISRRPPWPLAKSSSSDSGIYDWMFRVVCAP